MFNLKKYLVNQMESQKEPQEQDPFERIQVATCVILLEAARYDDEFSDVEKTAIRAIIEEDFGINDEDAEALIELATKKRAESRSLRDFTHWINENYTEADRRNILESAWKVIFADEKLHSYEDHFIHKLAKLLRFDHKELIDAKLKVKYRS